MKFMKSVILPCVAALNLCASEPVVNFFELTNAPGKFENFRRLGEENILNSLEKERDTLAMMCVSRADDENSHFVFEIYADEAAYEAHRQSPHFRAYIEQSKDLVVRKEFIKIKNLISLSKGTFAG